MIGSRFRGVIAAAAVALAATSALPAAAYDRPQSVRLVPDPNRVIESDNSNQGGGRWVTDDGRFVVIASATAFSQDDTDNYDDIYLWDTKSGRIRLVSVNPPLFLEGEPHVAATQTSFTQPSMTPDGRYITFQGTITVPVPNPNDPDQQTSFNAVYVWEKATDRTTLVSTTDDGKRYVSLAVPYSRLSDDGKRVAFLIGTDCTTVVLVAVCTGETTAVVREWRDNRTIYTVLGRGGAKVDGRVDQIKLSGDGNTLVFRSGATNLTESQATGWNLFAADLDRNRVELLTVDATGATPQGQGTPHGAAVSRDGSVVAFFDTRPFVPTVRGGAVYVRDRARGTTERVSVNSAGEALHNVVHDSVRLSASGRHVMFIATDSELDVLLTNVGRTAGWVHDRQARTTEPLRTTPHNTSNGYITYERRAELADDGHRVLLTDDWPHLPADNDDRADFYVVERGPALGVFSATATRAASYTAKGKAVFGGGTVGTKSDAASDAESDTITNKDVGQELVGFDVLQRVEDESVLLRWRLKTLPQAEFSPLLQSAFGQQGGHERVTYRARFLAQGRAWEVQARRLSPDLANAGKPTTLVDFGLYSCSGATGGEGGCIRSTALRGGMGTTGIEVVVAVPWSAIGARPGEKLDDVTPATVTTQPTNLVEPDVYDTISSMDVETVVPSVWLHTVPTRGARPARVKATLNNADFVGSARSGKALDISVCFGTTCTTRRF